MPKILYLISLFLLFFVAFGVSGQTVTPTPATEDDKWMRVQSDDGEFSIEVPKKHNYFIDEEGFSISNGSRDFAATKMQMLNAMIDGNLVSFERYAGSKEIVQRILEFDKNRKEIVKSTEIDRDGNKIKEIILETKDSYSIRQYFHSKGYVYVLTALSRHVETPAMSRFLNSLVFKPNSTDKTSSGGTLLSQLQVSPINIAIKVDPDFGKNPSPGKASGPVKVDENIKRLTIVSKPAASYTEDARRAMVAGVIVLKVTFAKDGFVPQIIVIKSLPNGLVRQAVFCVLRIKFLPQEKDGNPETVIKAVEYSFDIR